MTDELEDLIWAQLEGSSGSPELGAAVMLAGSVPLHLWSWNSARFVFYSYRQIRVSGSTSKGDKS